MYKRQVVKNVPAPPGPTGGPLRALIYDSVYDEYKVRPHGEQLAVTVTVAVTVAVTVTAEVTGNGRDHGSG